MATDYENNEEIKIFREYLRIPSVHPNIDYGKWLTSLKSHFCSYISRTSFYRALFEVHQETSWILRFVVQCLPSSQPQEANCDFDMDWKWYRIAGSFAQLSYGCRTGVWGKKYRIIRIRPTDSKKRCLEVK